MKVERDFAVRFSDEVYASKDEVRKSLAISSIDSIWDRIHAYRNYFRNGLNLVSIEHKSYSVCLTSSIQRRLVSLEKALSKRMVSILKLDTNSLSNIEYQALFNIARDYARENSLNISDETLEGIVKGRTAEVPQLYISLKNYISTIQFYLHRSASKYDLSVLTSFYGKILRKDINSNDFESFCRLIDLNNPADHVRFGNHYNAAPLDRIQTLLSDVLNFAENSTLFTLVKAITVYFYLIYIKPFDYFNEECAILSLKYIVAHDDNDVIPFLLNIEKRLLNINEEKFNQKFILSEMSLDLTYFLNFVLDIVEDALKEFDELYSMIDIISVKQEFSKTDEKITTLKTLEYTHPDIVVHNNHPVVFEQKVSMPTLPTGLDEKDIALIADNLLELYPSLKVNQAKFYASHCTIGKYYSIAQYKKETGVAYETARTSMDNLVNLGFYKKEQIKNKFVYTPVVR